MTAYKFIAYDPVLKRLNIPGLSDSYVAERPVHLTQNLSTDALIDGRSVGQDGSKLDFITITGPVDMDAIEAEMAFITVTQAVNLDTLQARVNELDASVVLKGEHDFSTALFPVSTKAGESWICSVSGTAAGVDFEVGDRVVALVDGAPTGSYATYWLKLDYSDKVSSVAGKTGGVTLVEADITDLQSYLLPTDIDTLAKLNLLVGDTILTTEEINTLAELNAIVGDATLIDTADARLSDARTPVAHTHPHTDLSTTQVVLNTAYATRKLSFGSIFLQGFYNAPAADANLTQASPTVTIGTVNGMNPGHVFIVFGAGSTDGSNVTLTASGTSYSNAGVRVPADSEVLYTGPVAGLTLNDYLETTKKFVGEVTLTLTSDGVNFTLDFNYGLVSSYDHNDSDFTVDWVSFSGEGEENDSGFNIEVIKHVTTGHTYSAAAFDPVINVIASSAADLVTEKNLVAGEEFAWKHNGLAAAVTGTGPEGLMIRVTTSVADSVTFMNGHIGLTVTNP